MCKRMYITHGCNDGLNRDFFAADFMGMSTNIGNTKRGYKLHHLVGIWEVDVLEELDK